MRLHGYADLLLYHFALNKNTGFFPRREEGGGKGGGVVKLAYLLSVAHVIFVTLKIKSHMRLYNDQNEHGAHIKRKGAHSQNE